MVLDLNALSNPAEKTKEQYMAEAAQAVAGVIRMGAMQTKNAQDAARQIIMGSEYFTTTEFNIFIGDVLSEQLANVDIATTEYLEKVSM